MRHLEKPAIRRCDQACTVEAAVRGIVLNPPDVTECELAEAQRIARVGSWAFDVAEDRARWSDEMYRVHGFGPRQFVPTYRRFLRLVHPDDRPLVREEARRALRGGAGGEGGRRGLDYRLVRPDGGARWVRSEYEVARDPSGRPVRLVGTSQDVTERRALEEELQHQALHDALTGLPNRALLLDRLRHALGRAERRGGEVAVLFLDLDDFKVVNDSLGHEAGDRLLVAVAERLRSALRPSDTAARLGGDEFVVLLEDVEGEGEAARVAGRVAEAFGAPFVLGEVGCEAFVTASVGVALGPGRGPAPGTEGAHRRDRAADLLRRADSAMYEAKEGGKARHAVSGSGADRRSERRPGHEAGLRRAIERGEFVVHYQPVVCLSTGRIAGFEALVRWERPGVGLVAPSEFVPLAEELGLIAPIGRWVLGEACRQARQWQERRPKGPPLVVGVNLSARQLSHPGLAGDVAAALKGSGLAPDSLALEVTERALVEDAEAVLDALRGIGALGGRFALDDFGTGHSPLSCLARLPAGLLKVAGPFVGRLGKGRAKEEEVLLSGVVGIAHGLGLRVCAEGVETEGQHERVKALGCDLAQGFLFSKPLPAEAATELVAEDLRWL